MNTREITKQYRLQQWTELVRECRSSGQKVTAWCMEHDVNPKKYYYWLKCVRTAAGKALPSMIAGKTQIVPVNIPALPVVAGLTEPVTVSAITLRFDAITLEIHNNASTTLIENTLRALQNVR